MKYGATPGVEGEPPFSIGCGETHLLHARVARAVQRARSGPSQVRTELLQQAGHGQDRVLHLLMQSVELGRELLGDLDPSSSSK